MNYKGPSISFLFPCYSSHAIGGYKVIYEQANRLSEIGWKVFCIYPVICEIKKKTLKEQLGDIKRFILYYFGGRHENMEINWFKINKEISHMLVFNLKQRNVPKTAFYCATALKTSYFLETYAVPEKNKLYYIQGFEAWGNHKEEDVYISYKFPMRKITIAPWLAERVRKVGQDSTLIPNGLDFDYFKLSNSIEDRSPYEIAMLYHQDVIKRCVDSINALKIVKQRIPQLHVTMFGTPDKPDLPEWFSYYQSPDKETHNKIYNTASVFIAASESEGFGLTVGEAMICGCAVACTDNGGFSMMISNDRTGLLSPVYDCQRLAENIIKLIEDNELRIELAKNGNEFIRQFTWEKAFALFKGMLES